MIATATISPQLTIPHLENGDKLTRREFERSLLFLAFRTKLVFVRGEYLKLDLLLVLK